VTIEAFISEAVVLLAAAVAVTLLSLRFRIPTVVGFLVTGLIIGPSGLRLVADSHQVEMFAEIGVIFLLFTIGLEFSLDRLASIRRAFFLGGSVQGLSAILTFALLGRLLGLSWPQAIFCGFLAVLSSTAIVLKLLADRRELETPQGKVAIGVLLFQDFLIVPMILLTPVLAGRAEASPLAIVGRFALGLVIVGVVFVVARYLMPRLLWAIVRTRAREILILGALLVCLGMALFTESLGFSLALGAFLAGIIVSESEYSHQIVAEVVPFRDVFNSIFFISIGMLLDLGWAAAHLGQVLVLTAAIIVGKVATTAAAAAMLGYPSRIVTTVGLTLAQVGEFSFVLLGVGRHLGLVDDGLAQLFLAAAVSTMALTPLAIALAPRLAGRRGVVEAAAGETPPSRGRQVIVVGFGVGGRSVARVLKEAGIPYTVIELAGEAVRRASRAGEPIQYGDVTRQEILEHAGIRRAGVIVFMISDLVAVRRAVPLARSLAPDLHIVVRTRSVADVEGLIAAGANEVIAEDLETSIEIFTRVLQHFHVPGNVIRAETRLLRSANYQMLRSPGGATVPEAVLDVLAAGTTDVFRLEAGSPAAGREIRDLAIRSRTGASVIAVVRDGQPRTNPPADFELAVGDSVVLVGNHAEIDRAFELLGGALPSV
jgi:CPA2 family monovalent cation:H+ antiporter-2